MRQVQEMFDAIAPTYDRLNHLLSFGLDFYWRKMVRKQLPKGRELDLLDLATGSGDQLLALVKGNASIRQAVGVDFSKEMLGLAKSKVKEARLFDKVQLHGAS